MWKYLCPDMFVESIYEIDLEELKNKNIKYVITDLDNTLVSWNQKEVDEKLADWLALLKEQGFKVCIVSNNSRDRVKKFADKAGIPAYGKAIKPRRKTFRLAMEQLEAIPQETVVIGDQIFTDVLGGNRTGLFTILVLPINQKEFIGTRLVRQVEKEILKSLKKRGLMPGN